MKQKMILLILSFSLSLSACTRFDKSFDESSVKNAYAGDRFLLPDRDAATPAMTTTTDATSVTQITEPVTEITEPVTEITEPVTEITEPVTEITEPVTEITEPVTQITEPVTEITEPVTEITEPVTEITEPVTEITEPVTEETPSASEPDMMSYSYEFSDGVYHFSNGFELSELEFVQVVNCIANEAGSEEISVYDKALVAEVVFNRFWYWGYPSLYDTIAAPSQFSGSANYIDLTEYSCKVNMDSVEALCYFCNNFDSNTFFQEGYFYFIGDGHQNHFR